MSWSMYSAEESEAQRVAKEAADKVIADSAAKEAQRVIEETAAKTLAEETIAKAAAGEVTRAANDDMAMMTARDTHSRDMRDIAESVKKLDMKDLREVMDGKLHMTDSELATALAKKEEERTTGREGRTADGRTNGTTIQTIETEAALTAAGVGHNLEEEKKLAAREGRSATTVESQDAGFAAMALPGAIGVMTAVGMRDSKSREDAFTEPADERNALVHRALDLTMSVKDGGDAIAAGKLSQILATNGTKADIEIAMAQLADAEQHTDKHFKTRSGKTIDVVYDGDPSTADVTVSSSDDMSYSGGGDVGDDIGGAVAAMMGGGKRGGRGGRAGGHRRGGMNAPLETAIGALALLEGAGGTKELKAMTALLTGGMDGGDPFALSSPQTPGRERSPDLGLFLA